MDTAVLNRCIAENQLFVRHYAKNATVHHQHEACSVLDVVLSGKLVAYSLSENGSAITMFEFQPNSIIGANLLFGENAIYPLNIYGVTPCDVLHISREAVMEFLRDYHFVMRYIKSLSLNSQGMNRKITMLTQKTLRENLMDYLKQQSIMQGSSKIVLPFSKKEPADYLGVQRPSLFRELKKLKDEGIIEIDNRTIQL
jgi:CRP-like cAMP-binding protein